MIEALTYEDIRNDYPKVFQAGRPRCGFGVGRGWEGLIRELCQKIEELLPEEHDFSVQQVKEKFGSLRFYAFAPALDKDIRQKIDKLIELAERQSFEICEVCGAPARIETGGRGWVRALCQKHREEQEREYEENNTRSSEPRDDTKGP